MLRIPKRTEFRKLAKLGRPKASIQPTLRYGEHGRCSAVYSRITARQIEAARRVMRFRMSRQGKLWILTYPNRPYTAKPAEVRMGGGAGSVKFWGQMVKPGTVRFEMRGVHSNIAKSACEAAGKKLGFPTRMISRMVVRKPATQL